MEYTMIGKTASVCPVCLRQVAAERVLRGGDVFLRKTCAEHGDFETVLWRGVDDAFSNWLNAPQNEKDAPPQCPSGCADCDSHQNSTCCALVEITSRCNLRCPICFADAGGGAPDPSVAELENAFRELVDGGNTFVQLSGGEPTVRDDLPEIIAAARRAGVETVQLNSNGRRLAREPEFTQALANAGLSFVFLQFDGVTDDVYTTLRGEALFEEKRRAIEVCGGAGLGVTLVPTLVPGVNDGQIGAILDFAVSNSPVVRGVHFQPVSYFGRYPQPPRDADRITLPEVLRAIELQTQGKFKLKDFNPSSCDHPRCGFHGDFAVLPKGKLLKLTKKYDAAAACCDDAHLKNRAFVARRWTRDAEAERSDENSITENDDKPELSAFLRRVKSHGFTVSAMAFQDAYTLDLERLTRCSLSVFRDGK
ncbi:MAG: radical SAM protein, partial [Oscillospiraceae bacterium]|nr:radical SAM protein [Oscillospiraceae bacterium]